MPHRPLLLRNAEKAPGRPRGEGDRGPDGAGRWGQVRAARRLRAAIVSSLAAKVPGGPSIEGGCGGQQPQELTRTWSMTGPYRVWGAVLVKLSMVVEFLATNETLHSS